MPIMCVCCDVRMEPNNRRPFNGIAMRLFVSARRNMLLPDSGSICNACRMSYRNWRYSAEFVNIFDRLEEESNEMLIDVENKVRFYNIYIYICTSLYVWFFFLERWSEYRTTDGSVSTWANWCKHCNFAIKCYSFIPSVYFQRKYVLII